MPPRPVNTITHYQAANDGATVQIAATTALPAHPLLGIFCCDPILIDVPSRRGADVLIHGMLKRFPCVPLILDPTTAIGENFTWTFSPASVTCPNCNIMIFELGPPPTINWTSAVRPCPPVSGVTEWVYHLIMGVSIGFPINPAQLAFWLAEGQHRLDQIPDNTPNLYAKYLWHCDEVSTLDPPWGPPTFSSPTYLAGFCSALPLPGTVQVNAGYLLKVP